LIELVDFNEIYGKGTEKAATTTSKRTRRAGGAGKKKAEAPAEEVKATEAPEADQEKKAE